MISSDASETAATVDDPHDPHDAFAMPSDLRTHLDELRNRCPVHRESHGSLTVLGHAAVTEAARDAETFSSAVSRFRAIPNSLDGVEHRAYRALIDQFFTTEEVSAQEAQCHAHAAEIVGSLPRGEMVRTLLEIGTTFAVRAQRTWLGWPESLDAELVAWVSDKREASRIGDSGVLAEIAERFDAIITRAVKASREGDPESVTARLVREEIDGRPLTHAEVVSILRNWTAGDLGSLAACVGVIVHHLASDVALQGYLRDLVLRGDHAAVEAALEEVLRIDDPFVSNRRIATRDTELGGVPVAAGTQVHLNWTAANRDGRVFADPDAFNPEAHAAHMLVFGLGPHACPGRALTLMELRMIIGELLSQSEHLAIYDGEAPLREVPPGSGWAHVPIVLR